MEKTPPATGEASPLRAIVSSLRLSEFIVMMRKAKVYASTVDVQRERQNTLRHCRAFNVPT